MAAQHHASSRTQSYSSADVGCAPAGITVFSSELLKSCADRPELSGVAAFLGLHWLCMLSVPSTLSFCAGLLRLGVAAGLLFGLGNACYFAGVKGESALFWANIVSVHEP